MTKVSESPTRILPPMAGRMPPTEIVGSQWPSRRMWEIIDVVVVFPWVQVEDGQRLRRALTREDKQPVPQYAEVCRRFLTDSQDFSEEKIEKAGIHRRFENRDLEECIREIEVYIRQEINRVELSED